MRVGLGCVVVGVLVAGARGAVGARGGAGEGGVEDGVGVGTRAAGRTVGRFYGFGDGDTIGVEDAAALAFEVFRGLAHVDGVLVQPQGVGDEDDGRKVGRSQ